MHYPLKKRLMCGKSLLSSVLYLADILMHAEDFEGELMSCL